MIKDKIFETYYNILKNIGFLEKIFGLLNKLDIENNNNTKSFFTKRNIDLLKISKKQLRSINTELGISNEDWINIEDILKNGKSQKKEEIKVSKSSSILRRKYDEQESFLK